jgi:DNA-binding MarR family transcriptional regulator
MLEELFFSKKMTRTIEHFILHEKWEQNQKDLCEALEIYQKAMKEILRRLVEYGLIKETKRIAKSRFFILNKESEFVKPLRSLSQKFGALRAVKMAELEVEKEREHEVSKTTVQEVEMKNVRE